MVFRNKNLKICLKDLYMGIVRFILAISVLLNHTTPYSYLLLSGRIPVQLFYMISGFLIALRICLSDRSLAKRQKSVSNILPAK